MPGQFSGPRQQSVSQSRFAMVPRSDVPRSLFRTKSAHKTTFDAGYLVPVYLNEVLPGDSFRMDMTAFARMSPAVRPIMDNLYMDSFWFFVPCRLLWSNWNRFMGERHPLPTSSTDYTVPVIEGFGSASYPGATPGSLADYFGLPTSDQLSGGTTGFDINALPFRGYCLIWDEWFRDQNMQDAIMQSAAFFDDGPDLMSVVGNILRRGKRHDYFTSCLPWPQKGDPTAIPLTGLAPIQGLGYYDTGTGPGAGPLSVTETARGVLNYSKYWVVQESAPVGAGGANWAVEVDAASSGPAAPPEIFADLSQATGALINDLRLANATQRLLERDARGGTRYTEILRSHFGVLSPDARLQRPEYLGGSSSRVHVNPVAQTSETGTTPLGELAGVGTAVHNSGFSQSFTEHGFIFGIINVRADLTYQQGMHRFWLRQTKFDYYWPAFAHLGEQAVTRKEIYATGVPASDDTVFGYQERWAEYRYFPSMITGLFRSGVTGTLDVWHLAQEFASAPTLSDTFIQDEPPMERVLSAAELSVNQQFLFDSVFDCNMVRAMPTYSVPGLGDRF